MASVNDCTFIGNLGRDPEVKYLESGDAVCSISIAVSERWKDKKSGEQKEHTEWIPLSFYGRIAEILGEYCKKGAPIYVKGKFSTRKYQKDGEDKYITEVKVFSLQLLGNKGDRQESEPERAKPAPKKAEGKKQDDFDDDIPF